MFDIQNYASFIAAIVVFQLAPGPGTVVILTATARDGPGAGFGAVAGTLLGDLLFMIGAVLGLAAVIHANPNVFVALQWFGAGYLVWLGVQMLRAPSASAGAPPQPGKGKWFYCLQAFTICLTNPKAVLFFFSFFPLFMRVDASFTTLGAMIGHVFVISVLYQVCLVMVGNLAVHKLSSLAAVRRLTTRLAGVALIGFGLRLAFSNR